MIRGLNELAGEFIEAHKKDLGYKEPYLTRSSHIGSVINDALHIIQHMDSWAKPRKGDCNLFIGGGSAYLLPEPYGVCLVLGTWNFPLPLCLKPAAAAISAGNCVCVKPSEVAPNISNVIKKLFDKYMDPDCYRVLEGGIQIASTICKHPWDLIFFTGGSAIGKKVAEAAA
jgi:aldehyde dehydrogenase (NAD+)